MPPEPHSLQRALHSLLLSAGKLVVDSLLPNFLDKRFVQLQNKKALFWQIPVSVNSPFTSQFSKAYKGIRTAILHPTLSVQLLERRDRWEASCTGAALTPGNWSCFVLWLLSVRPRWSTRGQHHPGSGHWQKSAPCIASQPAAASSQKTLVIISCFPPKHRSIATLPAIRRSCTFCLCGINLKSSHIYPHQKSALGPENEIGKETSRENQKAA